MRPTVILSVRGPHFEDAASDHSAICRFRNLLIERGQLEQLFAEPADYAHAHQAVLKAHAIKPWLARRPNRHHPKLPPRLAH